MHNIPPSGTSSPCNLLFWYLGIYGLVQATVGVGTALIWDFCVAYTRGGGGGGYVYDALVHPVQFEGGSMSLPSPGPHNPIFCACVLSSGVP